MNFSIDFGWKAAFDGKDYAEIQVKMNPTMFDAFSEAYLRRASDESAIKGSSLYDNVALTKEELTTYNKFLLQQRIASLTPQGSTYWSKLKDLYILDWIQFALSSVGVVIDEEHGLKFVPIYDEKLDVKFESIQATSEKIRRLMALGLLACQNAMPRSKQGDADFMGFAIVDDFVRGREKNQLPLMSYVAAFLGNKLVEEANYKVLFRVNYGGVPVIQNHLLDEGSIYGKIST